MTGALPLRDTLGNGAAARGVPSAGDGGGGVDLERELATVRARAAGPLAGVFGPDSVTWRIDREATVFLGAGRALLLQLAHPWVAAAVAEHSRVLSDRAGRFHRTFGVVHPMVFGTLDEALDAARRLHRRHAAIRGTLPAAAGPFAAGSAYRANDPDALRWVHATLVETGLAVHERVLAPLTAVEREAYWSESRLLGALFGVPAAALPPDWAGFAAYAEEVRGSSLLAVDDAARRTADLLLRGRGGAPGMPRWYEALTAHLLPEGVREGFRLPYGPAERLTAERVLAVARRLAPLLPDRLRHVGAYQEARARLAGRPRPDPGVGLANRIWIGRPRLALPPPPRSR